jgi:hypothetical protein
LAQWYVQYYSYNCTMLTFCTTISFRVQHCTTLLIKYCSCISRYGQFSGHCWSMMLHALIKISFNIALNILYNTMISLLPLAGWSADCCCCNACCQPINHKAVQLKHFSKQVKYKVFINSSIFAAQHHHRHWYSHYHLHQHHHNLRQSHDTPCDVGSQEQP